MTGMDRPPEQVPPVTSSPQALLFDFDYTLADSSRAVVRCANHALTGMGLEPASPDAICRTIGLSLPDTLAALTGEEHRSRVIEFRRLWRELSDQIMVSDTKLLPGMIEALVPLREKGLRLGIVSTKYRSRIAAVLDREGAGHLFDTIVGGEDVSEHKPHPEGLLRALEQLGLTASARAVYRRQHNRCRGGPAGGGGVHCRPIGSYRRGGVRGSPDAGRCGRAERVAGFARVSGGVNDLNGIHYAA